MSFLFWLRYMLSLIPVGGPVFDHHSAQKHRLPGRSAYGSGVYVESGDCLLARYFNFFRDKTPLPREALRTEAEANNTGPGADVGDAATLEGQPAGFTLRSSSRSAVAEEQLRRRRRCC